MKQFFFYSLYNLMTLLLLPPFLLIVGLPLFFQPDARKQVLQRFGFYPRSGFRGKRSGPLYWVHAASVGEVMLCRIFIQRFSAHFPEATVVFSTSTATGQAAAAEHLPEIDHLIYFPYDFFWVRPRALRRIKPDVFIFVETEIWPNLMKGLSKRGVPAVMINGRISDRSFPKYQKLKPLLSQVLKKGALFLMQSDADAEKIIALGAPQNTVQTTGNMKYDQGAAELATDKKINFSDLGLAQNTSIFIAGSTRPGEEEGVIEAWSRLREKHPDVVLLIAPRHLNRVSEIERLLKNEKLLCIRKTKIAGRFTNQSGGLCPVIVLDTLGELSGIYRLATFVFIGGSLVPMGGQNPLEAAATRLPIFFGPHMENFKEISEALLASGGAKNVRDGRDLGVKLSSLADSEAEYERMASAAYHCVLSKRGAVSANITAIASLLQKKTGSKP